MSRDCGPVLPLEQQCIEPGHWLIEGYTVIARRRRGRINGWRIENAPAGAPAEFLYLSDVRDWIQGQQGN